MWGRHFNPKMIHLVSDFSFCAKFCMFEMNWKLFVTNLTIKKKEFPIFGKKF